MTPPRETLAEALDRIRSIAERATEGPWFVDDMCGFAIGGCPPGQGPDDEVPEDWEPDDADDMYSGAKLSSTLEGQHGEFDLEFMVKSANFVRDLLAGRISPDPIPGHPEREDER